MTRLGPKIRGSGGAAMTAFAAALLLWAVVTQHRAAGPQAQMNGKYKVRVVGYGSGDGACVVTEKGVDVDCQIRDDGGNTQHLQAKDLKLDESRFHGNGALDGVLVRVAGRIDPPDASGPKPRFSATFLAKDGRSGRIVGTHE